jgi:hypothetical protein
VPSPLPASHVEDRAAKLRGWLAYLGRVWDEIEAEALARDDGGLPGFGEATSRTYTCGACGGRGCRKCHRGRVTITERDPYSTDLPATTTGVKLATSDPKSEIARIDREIDRLRRLVRIRAGAEVREDRHLRLIRAHERLTAGERSFLSRLERALSNGATLDVLAETMSGRIPRPPKELI